MGHQFLLHSVLQYLLVQDEDVSVVAGSECREGLKVAGNRLSGPDPVCRNVGHHPVQIFRLLVGQVAVRVGHDQRPKRVRVRVRFGKLERHPGAGGGFFGFNDVAWK